MQLSVTFQGDTATPAFETAYVGQLRWSGVQGQARDAGLPDAFMAYCIDGLQSVYGGMTHTFTDFTSAVNANPFGGANGAMGVNRANLLTQFWNQFGPADPAIGFSSATDSAAFQLAIWEIINDALPAGNGMTFSLSAGRFQVAPTALTAAAVVKAQQWMQSFDATFATVYTWYLSVLESPSYQGQITATTNPKTPDTGGCDGLPCPSCSTCSTSRVNKITGQAEVITVAGSGGGAATTPSIGLQLNQPATAPAGPSARSAAPAPFGNGWSRTAAPSLTMRGTDPANPTSVSIVFNSSDTRVYQNTSTSPG